MNSTIFFIILGIILVVLVFLQYYLSERDEKRQKAKDTINSIQSEILFDLKEFEEMADMQGEKYYNDLMAFAKQMEKLKDIEIRKDLKPYDVFGRKSIGKKYGRKLFARIVIDKNLEPKFLATPHSTIPERADIQLEASLNVDQVKALAEKCRKIKMESEMENFRLKKVNEAING